MKKIISLLVLLTLVATMFVACANKTSDETETTEASVEKDYTLAIGVVATPNLNSSKVSDTVAAIVTDADGKIVLCRFDCIEYTAKYADGVLDTTAPKSKAAQGDAYDAFSPMPAGAWYKQVDALATYITGKTQDEVAATALTNGYASDAELKASCSINVADLLKAVDNAFKSEHKTTFKTDSEALTAGISALGAVKDTATETEKNASFTADFAASVLADGKVVASILDSAEVELVGINDEGAATEAKFKGTKREQGAAYDSFSPMPAGTWYVQADAFAKTAIGKTADDIATLAFEGVAGCTIYAGGYKMAVEASVNAAK